VTRRILSFGLVAWALGFVWFAITLPQPAGMRRTDAIVVATGAAGRIQRGLSLLDARMADRMLVTGVSEKVKPAEFAAEYSVDPILMECCVTLGFAALDTRGNARETAEWAADQQVGSIRFVTSDWHMRRAALELENELPAGLTIVRDAVPTEPTLKMLFLEYHKLLAAWVVQAWPW
jgi:uncharacterized SAM-binding protein YcdF (DUF218 family)